MNKANIKTYGFWFIKTALTLVFISAGSAKLIGVEEMIAIYDEIGFGQWFRYITGILEVTAGFALLIRKFTLFAALILVCIMIGAIFTHLFLIGGSFIPALVLGILSSFIAYISYNSEKNKKGKSNDI